MASTTFEITSVAQSGGFWKVTGKPGVFLIPFKENPPVTPKVGMTCRVAKQGKFYVEMSINDVVVLDEKEGIV